MKLKIYPLKLVDTMNLDVKILAARANESMQDWMVKAIEKEIERQKAG